MRPMIAKNGFSLPEVILVTSLMAVVLTLAVPEFTGFMEEQRKEIETQDLETIQKGLQVFIQNNGVVPDEEFWFENLSELTTLGPDAVKNDQWGKERVFTSHTTQERFRDTVLDVNFVSIISSGPDQVLETPTDWNESGDNEAIVNAFKTLEAVGDDRLITFSDFSVKRDLYFEAGQRLDAITKALEKFEGEFLANALAANEAKRQANLSADLPVEQDLPYPNVQTTNFYPRSAPIEGSDAATYSADVQAEMVSIGLADGVVDQTRTDMILLMRLLGLPDEFCCNPLSFEDGGDTRTEKALFYFSNPRPRGGTSCGTRPTSVEGVRFLPPRVTLEYVSEADAITSGKVPTCG